MLCEVEERSNWAGHEGDAPSSPRCPPKQLTSTDWMPLSARIVGLSLAIGWMLTACSAAVSPDLTWLEGSSEGGASLPAPGLGMANGQGFDETAAEDLSSQGQNGTPLNPNDSPGPDGTLPGMNGENVSEVDAGSPDSDPQTIADPPDPVSDSMVNPPSNTDPVDPPGPNQGLFGPCFSQPDCSTIGGFCETQDNSIEGVCTRPCQVDTECATNQHPTGSCVGGRCGIPCAEMLFLDDDCPDPLQCVNTGAGGLFGGPPGGSSAVCLP